MKKYILLLIPMLFLLSSCSAVGMKKDTVADYFPIKENTIYEYDGNSPYSQQIAYDIYTQGNKVQKRYITNVTADYVVEVTEKAVTLTYGEIYNAFYEDYLEAKSNDNSIILQGPIQKGTTWEMGGMSSGTAEITNIDVDVEVPYGTFKAIEVTRNYDDGGEVLSYYAKDVGLVREVSRLKSTTTITSGDTVIDETQEDAQEMEVYLKAVTEETPITVKMLLFYPDDEYNLNPVEIESKIVTNENPIPMLEGLLKTEVSEGGGSLLSKNVSIKSISIDRTKEEPVILLDLSKEFIDDMNLGSGYEVAMLQGLTDTLCNYARISNEVLLTVEGKPYSSGHIIMDEGETFLSTWLTESLEQETEDADDTSDASIEEAPVLEIN